MSRVDVRDLGEPEAVVTYPLGASSQVRLGGTVVTRHVLQPGWSWVEHAQPLVGTTSCELYHRGVVLSGRMGIRTDEGEELIIGPNQVFDLPPGHVTWVEGDVLVMVGWAGGAGFDPQPGREARAMATILFTDIVDSTALARDAGDAPGAIQIPIRVGIHSGEVVASADHARGVAVHPAARIVARAEAGEVLASGITRDLTEGTTGFTFESRGRHRLKGLDREQDLFAAESAAG